MAGKKHYTTFTRKGNMISGRKARVYNFVTNPLGMRDRIEARRNARSAKRVGRKLGGKRR